MSYSEEERQAFAERMKEERAAALQYITEQKERVGKDTGALRDTLNVIAAFGSRSIGNCLLIARQKPDATEINPFDVWKAKGCNVSRGEKSIMILVPHQYKDQSGAVKTGYNVQKMFDISQTFSRERGAKTTEKEERNERKLLSALFNSAVCPIKADNGYKFPDNLNAVYDYDEKVIFVRQSGDIDFGRVFREVARESALAYFDSKGVSADRGSGFDLAKASSYVLCKKYGFDTKAFDLSDVKVIDDDLVKDTSENSGKERAGKVSGFLNHVADCTYETGVLMQRQIEKVSAKETKDVRDK